MNTHHGRHPEGVTKPSQSIVPIIAATIAACASVATAALTWLLTERIRTDVALQTLALEKVKVDISGQTLALEKVKVDLALAAQLTADVRARIDETRLDLDKRIAKSTEYLGTRKIQIEDKRSNTDEIRLTPEFSRLANDLRPSLKIECGREVLDRATHRVVCHFSNTGAHRASIDPTGISMVDRATQTTVPDAVAQFENRVRNTVLSGGNGSSVYVIRLAERGAQQSNSVLRISFKATTDEVAVNVAKRLSKGVLTDAELTALSAQTYNYFVE